MLAFIIQRILRMIPLFFLLSIIAFTIIQLPPGDYLTEHINNLRASGMQVDQTEVERLTKQYALDRPMYIQYTTWIGNILTKGYFGQSFQWGRPVNEVIGERLMLTFLIAFLTTIFVWVVALPIGIYISVRQYTFADYFFTLVGFIGLAVPGFLLALVIMYFSFAWFDVRVGGLFSSEYQLQPWSWGKVQDMMTRIWVPIVILGVGGTANIIRIMRATMLDELRKQYVTVARAKGLSEFSVLMRYPVRIAINPLISTIGWLLPWFISGGTVVNIVLNLDTAGVVLWRALLSQDMFLAGSYVLIIGSLTLLGSLISDVLLAVVDPRIRFGSTEGL
ncbi:MAG: ABC transporter permease [Chloroflexi bacterium]|nr:ABC transporter permease [Chloroflexota bacterium]